jgi:SAM-dependent methyltransferase
VENMSLEIRRLFFKLYDALSSKKEAAHPFDVKHGTETSSIVRREALAIPKERMIHAVRYQTAIVEVFCELLNSLPIPHEEFLFIDLGSGKGRALLLASKFPFKGIIGVELSEDLHRTACRNIRFYRNETQRCFTIESVCKDVVDYKIPDENIAFYLFNPFDAHVMEPVLRKIEGSLKNSQREIYIAYLKPVYRVLFDRSKFFHIEKDAGRYVIYKNN